MAGTSSGVETTGIIDGTTTGDIGTGSSSSGSTTTDETSSGSSSSGSSSSGSSSSGSTTGGSSSSGEESSSSTGGDDGIPAFVGMSGDDSIMVFDQIGHTVLDGPINILPEGDYPYDVTIRPDGAEVWIAGASGDGIVVLDAVTNAILHQGGFSTGANTYAVDVAFSPDSSTAYVAARDADALVVVDTATFGEVLVSPTPGATQAGKMAVNPCTGQVYMVEWFGSDLMTYDPGTDAWATVTVGGASLWDLAIDPTGSALYVTDRSNDQVHVFNVSGGALPAAVPDTSINVGDDPWGIDMTSDGATVIVACEDDNSVHFIDTAMLSSGSLVLPADSDPRDVDVSEDDAVAYIPNGDVGGDDGVYAIDIATQTLADTITLGPGTNANSIAVAPQSATCDAPSFVGFVGMSGSDSLVTFDTTDGSLVGGPLSLLPEGNYPYDATVHPNGDTVWIAGASGDGFVVVDTLTGAILNQSVLSVAMSYPVDVAFSPDGAEAYISDRDADALIVVDTATWAELLVTTTPGSVAAGKIAVNPCTGLVHMVEWFGDELMTWDPATDLWATVDIGNASLWDLAVAPDGNTLYATDRSNDQVHVFDLMAGGGYPAAIPDASVIVGDDPWGIAMTDDGSTVVVACEDDATVHFIDTVALTANSLALDVDADPRDVEIDGNLAYVPSGMLGGDDAVYAIDIAAQMLSSTIPLGGQSNANCVAVAPQNVSCAP